MIKLEDQILFEDEHLILVNKPSGLLSIPDRFDATIPNLYHTLLARDRQPFIVHRLDRDTSGIICFAKSAQAHQHLSLQFEHRSVKKVYLALVEGQVQSKEGSIETGIAPHPTIKGKMMVSKKGKPAYTSYRLSQAFRHFTLLEVLIESGRTHQIRVHLASIGYPLAVDSLYGRRETINITDIKSKVQLGKEKETRPLLARNSLHAFQLSMLHPISGEWLTFEAPLHKDFRALLNQLEKWDAIPSKP